MIANQLGGFEIFWGDGVEILHFGPIWAASQWHCLPPKPTSHKPVGWVFFMWFNQLVGFFLVLQPVGWVNQVEPGKPVNLKNRFSASFAHHYLKKIRIIRMVAETIGRAMNEVGG